MPSRRIRGLLLQSTLVGVVAVIAAALLAFGGSPPPARAVGAASALASLRRAAAARTAFPAAAAFDYQIGGAYPPPAGVEIVDRDRSARPVPGLYNVCYVNAFQAQVAQVGWWRRHHPDLLLHTAAGRLVIDPNWGEPLLDVSSPAKRTALLGIVGGWIDGCAHAGFQAVEPDNLDSYLRSQGRLTLADDLAFAKLLARRAHADGLDIAQKNLAENSRQVHALGFDFAIAEQCQQYSECRYYTGAYGHALIDIEYQRASFTRACAAHAGQYSIVLRDVNVVPRGSRGYVDQRCRGSSAA